MIGGITVRLQKTLTAATVLAVALLSGTLTRLTTERVLAQDTTPAKADSLLS
jgi:hypothetical protein